MAHSKNKILLLVEGAKAEPALMDAYKKALNDERLSLEIISFKTNIYVLYLTLKKLNADFFKEDVSDTIDVLRSLLKKQNRLEELEILKQDFAYIYLLFDLDLQDEHLPNQQEVVQEMMDYFNDETDHGLLLLDYPMVEAFLDYQSPAPDANYRYRTIRVSSLLHYKEIVRERGNRSPYHVFGKRAFLAITRQNIMKANQIVYRKYQMPSYAVFKEFVQGRTILLKEFEWVKKHQLLSVLCSAVFIYPSFFGRKYYEEVLKIKDS